MKNAFSTFLKVFYTKGAHLLKTSKFSPWIKYFNVKFSNHPISSAENSSLKQMGNVGLLDLFTNDKEKKTKKESPTGKGS